MHIESLYNSFVRQMSNCSSRTTQLAMIQEIDKSLNNSKNNVILIEAPTGTGKSLAYLMAGTFNAIKLNKTLIISTATKALQAQLVEKDIPNFIKYSHKNLKYNLAKGRANYLCPYQLELNMQDMATEVFAESHKTYTQLEKILNAFNEKKWDGDLNHTPFHIDEQLKPKIITDKERCIAYSCPYNQKDNCTCPFYSNREKLKNSNIIVINHSLLLADVILGGGILPVKLEESILCIDEGHSFSNIAINSFMQSFELKNAINHCYSLAKLVYNPQKQNYIYPEIGICQLIVSYTEELAQLLEQFLTQLSHNIAVFKDNSVILNDYINPNLTEFKDHFINFAYVASNLYDQINKLQEKIKEKLKGSIDTMLENNLNKISFYINLVEKIVQTSKYIINQDNSRYNANAKWIDIKNNDEFIINAGLSHVGNMLSEKLWNRIYAGVVTSATLSIGQSFTYYMHKLGLKATTLAIKLDSEFDYLSQAQIVVPRFNYSPEFATKTEFNKELANYLIKVLAYTEGYGTLVLFFNRLQLQDIFNLIPKNIQKNVLLQTEYLSSQRIINEHRANIDSKKPSIIFGLNSFAEGIDLPQLYCMHVIITKLPFETINNPYSIVQEYWFKFEKCSYFMDVTLPETCIKLIQACGRLIRSEKDYGQITICDNRIVTKSYGKTFLDALPNFNRKYNSNFMSDAFNRLKKK